MKPRQFLIYGLIDPRDGLLRYVGWSSWGLGRAYAGHAAKCRSWEKSLKNQGLKKQVVVIQDLSDLNSCSDDEVNRAWAIIEPGWIAYFRKLGFNLLNMTDGGEGAMGRRLSETTRRRMSEERMGAGNPMFGKKPHSAGKPGWMTGAKGADHPMTGYKHSLENRKKMSEAAKRYWASKRS